jgi:predicted acylesterase/phospholipase RssA
LIRRWVELARIEQAAIRLAVTTTDAPTGEPVVLTTAAIGDVLAASSAIPGPLSPGPHRRSLVDRWRPVGHNRPVLQAQALEADDVYVITATSAPRLRPPRGEVAMAMNSASLVTARADHNQLAVAIKHAKDTGRHVLVVPSSQPSAPGPFDFRRSAAPAKAAYQPTILGLTTASSLANPGSDSSPADKFACHMPYTRTAVTDLSPLSRAAIERSMTPMLRWS